MFWVRQGSSLVAFAAIVVVALSIWFDNAARLTAVAGFATAGLAIAAWRAVTAFSGYLIILRPRRSRRRPHQDGRRSGVT